jgi:hypothetical protein
MIRFEAASSALFFAIISSGSQSSGISPGTFGRSDPPQKSESSSVIILFSRRYLKTLKDSGHGSWVGGMGLVGIYEELESLPPHRQVMTRAC